MELPALIKILIVFSAMLALIRLKVHMGLALVLGGFALCLWAGRGVATSVNDFGYALGLSELWLLLLIIALIFEYGRHMAEGDNAQVIMNGARALGGRHGRSVSLMAIPAAIGLVPMPGGALFSAPLVDQSAPGESWDPVWKSSVNYWFRHTWEYWWPLYPVVIVSLSIFDMEMGWFILMQLPLSAATWAAGYLLLIRPHQRRLADHVYATGPDDGASSGNRWRIAAPLLIVVGAALVLPPLFQRVFPVLTVQTHRLVAMLVGLGLGLWLILRESGPGASVRFLRTLYDRKIVSLLGTVGGVIIFKTLLDRSGLLPLAGDDLMNSGVPLVVVVALLPWVAGFVTGIAIGFAGITFPLLAGLATASETGLAPASTLLLGFAFGYAGMMCSPVHLCFILSSGYFSVPLARMYRYIVPCTLIPLATAVALYWCMTQWHW